MLFAAGLWAGTQNALAGGGSFVTLPALMLSGLDARAANITSTLALFPGQIATGLAGRKMASGAEGLTLAAPRGHQPRRAAWWARVLLLATPSSVFAGWCPG